MGKGKGYLQRFAALVWPAASSRTGTTATRYDILPCAFTSLAVLWYKCWFGYTDRTRQLVCRCMCFCSRLCWTMQGRIHAKASHRVRQVYCLCHVGAALVRPDSDYLCTQGLPLIICMLQGDEYDELGSVPSQLHDVIIGASDDESQSLVYGASDADGQSFTDASERFRPGSSTGSVSEFGTKSPSQL